MSNADPIVVVTGADDDFALPMAVTLYSTLVNLERGRSVALYIMDGGISDRNRRRLIQTLKAPDIRAQITWLTPDLMRLEDLPVAGWLAPATYLRLFIPDLLPSDCDRALYLDSDLVVEGDVGHLWEQDLRDVRAYGVPNYSSPIVAWKREAVSMFRSFGLSPETPFCNAGVLLLNLKRWREEQLAQQALDLARRFALPESDQDAINIAVAGQWGVLDARWNVQLSAIQRYGRFLTSSLSLSEQDAAQACAALQERAYILHFTSVNKPWRFACQQPSRTRFFHYLRQTHWFGDVQDEDELMERTFSEQPGFESWMSKVASAEKDLAALIPPGGHFIFVDEATWPVGTVARWRTVPFLERDGQYWGLPSDDATAILEFERLRKTGVTHLVFAWPAFWWLEQYSGWRTHLHLHFARILNNERVIVFDLHRQPTDYLEQ